MNSILKNLYIGKIEDVVDKYNNICHSTIKMKSTDVKVRMCIDLEVENNDKDPNKIMIRILMISLLIM